jgi:nucleotide-binding universal stress UspA family protein
MKVLVATDGSASSQIAICSLLNMPWPDGTELKVMMVVDFYQPLPAIEELKQTEIQSAHAHVSSVVHMLETGLPNCKISGAVVDGFADQMIVEEAFQWHANLIVVGTHGRRGLSKFLLGSVSRSILMTAQCPVRIVRPPLDGRGSIGAGEFNVLVASDDSDAADHALQHTLDMKWPELARFKCVSVVADDFQHNLLSSHDKRARDHHQKLMQRAEERLNRCARRLQEKFGVERADFEVLEGEPRSRILDTAEKWPADMIVMGSYGRPFVERIMVGSVSEAVAMHAPCSIEILPLPKPARLHVII